MTILDPRSRLGIRPSCETLLLVKPGMLRVVAWSLGEFGAVLMGVSEDFIGDVMPPVADLKVLLEWTLGGASKPSLLPEIAAAAAALVDAIVAVFAISECLPVFEIPVLFVGTAPRPPFENWTIVTFGPVVRLP